MSAPTDREYDVETGAEISTLAMIAYSAAFLSLCIVGLWALHFFALAMEVPQ